MNPACSPLFFLGRHWTNLCHVVSLALSLSLSMLFLCLFLILSPCWSFFPLPFYFSFFSTLSRRQFSVCPIRSFTLCFFLPISFPLYFLTFSFLCMYLFFPSFLSFLFHLSPLVSFFNYFFSVLSFFLTLSFLSFFLSLTPPFFLHQVHT